MKHFAGWGVAVLLGWSMVMATPAIAQEVGGRAFYVNNETGDDAADGLAGQRTPEQKGPFRTLKRAVADLKPGDALHLAATATPYRETLRLNGVRGEAARPIVIDGHGATLCGDEPLRPEEWVVVTPGLYKNAKLKDQLEKWDDFSQLQRMYFRFAGQMQHMGRTSKGKLTPLPKPEELKPGEWTYDEKERTFYVRVAGELADAQVTAPIRLNGVAVHGGKNGSEYLVIRNFICTHFLNDGYNIHEGKKRSVKNLRFENIVAIENGDDGYSNHESVETEVDGLVSIGNSTGSANGQESTTRLRNLYLADNLAAGILMDNASAHEVRNAVILSAAPAKPLRVGTGKGGATSVLENVLVRCAGASIIEINLASRLQARQATIAGAAWRIRGEARVQDSVIAGSRLECVDGVWAGERNAYAITRSVPDGSDVNPRPEVVTPEMLQTQGQPLPGCGADLQQMKLPPLPGQYGALRWQAENMRMVAGE